MKNQNTILFFAVGLLFLVCLSSDISKGTESGDDVFGIREANRISSAFRSTSKKVIPAVVKIVVHQEKEETAEEKSLPFGDLSASLPEDEQDVEGIGSGVLVDSKGLVLTNNHVVSDRKNITVELFDGRQFTVKKVCKDQQSDLAVLWLDSKDVFPILKFADSEELEIGDWVLAIGNPFMLESSVSAGIVSAKKRNLGKEERGLFIQTDAAVNPGNSGGPLVNLRGEIVGINTAIASLSGGNQGIGFAIPSNTARWIFDQLVQKGKVERAFLGASIVPLTYKDRQRYSLTRRQGVRLRTPFKESPAANAGLRRNDILLSFDNKPIESPELLESMIESADIYKNYQLKILRDPGAQSLVIPLRLQIQPENYVGVPVTEIIVQKGSFYKDRIFGMMLMPLTSVSAQRLGIKAVKGLVALSVFQAGSAYRAGLRDSMVIIAIDGNPIESVDDYLRLRDLSPEQKTFNLTILTQEGEKQLSMERPAIKK